MRLIFKQEVEHTASVGVLSMDICSVRHCKSGRIQGGFDWNSSATFESLTQCGFHDLHSASRSKVAVILGIPAAFSVIWVLPSWLAPCWAQGWSRDKTDRVSVLWGTDPEETPKTASQKQASAWTSWPVPQRCPNTIVGGPELEWELGLSLTA